MLLLVVDQAMIRLDYLVGDIDIRFVDGVDGMWFEDDRAKGNVGWLWNCEMEGGWMYELLVVHSNM